MKSEPAYVDSGNCHTRSVRQSWRSDRRRRGDLPLGAHGLTLLELMAAVSLFGLMAVAFASLSMSTLSANHEARRVTAAANLARDKIEELRAANFAAVSSGADSSAMTESGGSGTGSIYTRTWTVASGPSGTKQVTVKVAWTDGSTRDVELTTLIGS